MNEDIYVRYGYLMYPVNLEAKPEIEINNTKYLSKSSYHISLICLEEFSEIQQNLIFKFVQTFVQENPIELNKITKTFRLVTEGKLQSIIVRVKMRGLKKLISAVNIKFGYKIVYPPTHITLFTLPGQHGIGVDTLRRYRLLTQRIDLKDSQKLMSSYRLQV